MPAREPVGQFVNPRAKSCASRAHPSVSFPASQIHAITGTEGEPAAHDGELHGSDRPARRAAALLHRADHRAAHARKTTPLARLLRHFQPPHDFAVLPGLGEIPLHGGLRARRARPLLASSAGPDRSRHRGLAEPAGGRRRFAAVLRGPAGAVAALGDRAAPDSDGLFRGAGRDRAVRRRLVSRSTGKHNAASRTAPVSRNSWAWAPWSATKSGISSRACACSWAR